MLAAAALLASFGVGFSADPATAVGSPHVAATAPAPPQITSLLAHYGRGSIILKATVCTGCVVRAAWQFGGQATYPTSYQSAAHHRHQRPNGITAIPFGREGDADLTTYLISVWAYSTADQTYSSPVHKQIAVAEYINGITPKAQISANGAHSLQVNVLPATNGPETAGFKVYINRGDTIAGKPRVLPHRNAVASCSGAHCALGATVTIPHLRSFSLYRLAIYGFDRHHNYREAIQDPVWVAEQGLHVTGAGTVIPGTDVASSDVASSAPRTAFVRDSSGTEHVLAIVGGPTAAQNQLEYLTRPSGATHWTTDTGPLTTAGGYQTVFATLSNDGAHVFLFAYACNGIYTAEVATTSSHLPTFALAMSTSNCSFGVTPTLVDATALPGGQAALLLAPQGPGYPSVAVDLGQPGGAFTAAAALPHSGAIPEAIAEDASTAELVVAAVARQTHHLYVWTSGSDGTTWNARVTLVTGIRPIQIDSLAAAHGKVWIGFEHGVARKLFTEHSTRAGGWSQPNRLPHSVALDIDLRLAINPLDGHVHAVFNRGFYTAFDSGFRKKDTYPGGVMHEELVDGKWSALRQLTHWYDDMPTQLTLTAHGHPIVSYLREWPPD
jgi:hypothetical protein